MDHSHMDHGDMGGGGHDMPMCSMNVRLQPILNQQEPPPQLIRISSLSIQMLFTWDTTNLCIVFPSWRVTGTLSLIVSLLAVVALTAGYEAIREVSRRYEERLEQNVREAPRKFLPSPIGGVLFGVYSAGRVWLFWVTSKPVAYAYLFTRTQRRRRTKLTPYYYGRQCRRGGREEGQDGQGCAVRRAGVLFVLHHVSSSYSPLCWLRDT